jgi:hypothetical protein
VEVVKLFLDTLLANDEENVIAIVNISTSFTQSQQTKKTRHQYPHDQPQALQEPDLQTEYLPYLTSFRTPLQKLPDLRLFRNI